MSRLPYIYVAGCLALLSCNQKPFRTEGKPAKLLSGMGHLHHPIATRNPEAQQFFDQGLTFTYAFNFAEAVHSFRRAAQLDPQSPMPYWGMALAEGPNYNSWHMAPGREDRMLGSLQRARELSVPAPESERGYVSALSVLSSYLEEHRYADAMRELSRRYPDDPDAAALYAAALMNLHPWKLWNVDGTPGEDTLEITCALEGVLKRWPRHVGATHLYIDLVRTPRNPRSLFGLWKSLAARNKTTEAKWIQQSFDENWKGIPRQLCIDDL